MIDELIGPEYAAEFGRAYPDEYRIFRGALRRDILSWSDLDAIIAGTSLPSDRVSVVVDGKRTRPDSQVEVATAVAQGRTLVLRGLEFLHEPTADILDRLSLDLSERLSANLYVSDAVRPGFHLHYDSHDVLVLQLAGSKRWNIHERVVPYLVSGQPENDERLPADKPVESTVLAAGDVLYLPRGYWHAPVAVTRSMHLTIGIYQRTAADVLDFLGTELVRRSVDLRRPAPLSGSAPGEVLPKEHRDWFTRTLDEIALLLRDGDLVDAYQSYLAYREAPRPRRIYAGDSHAFRLSRGLKLSTTRSDDGSLVCTSYGATVTLPAGLSGVVAAVSTAAPFTVDGLAATVPDARPADVSALVGSLRELGWIEPA